MGEWNRVSSSSHYMGSVDARQQEMGPRPAWDDPESARLGSTSDSRRCSARASDSRAEGQELEGDYLPAAPMQSHLHSGLHLDEKA
jgi:hypothetical protein